MAEAELTPPETGDPEIDAALDSVRGIGELPVAEHPERLSAAHDVLRAALDRPAGNAPAA